jgi:hypothetical protein
MAYIVKIKSAIKTGMNVNDVVSIQDVKPSAKEYSIFAIEETKGTAAEIHAQMQAALPERKMVWLDSATGEYKEVIKQPLYLAKYMNGVFTHNYGVNTDNTVSIATKITAAEKAKIAGVNNA